MFFSNKNGLYIKESAVFYNRYPKFVIGCLEKEVNFQLLQVNYFRVNWTPRKICYFEFVEKRSYWHYILENIKLSSGGQKNMEDLLPDVIL